jgi:putative endonuclease
VFFEDLKPLLAIAGTYWPDLIALPREFVDSRKQQRLRSAAELYLAANELDVPVRFDVAEVYDEGGSLRISYIENAFI